MTADDECDFCGQTGVTQFTPVVLRLAMMLILGDACTDCHAVLHSALP